MRMQAQELFRLAAGALERAGAHTAMAQAAVATDLDQTLDIQLFLLEIDLTAQYNIELIGLDAHRVIDAQQPITYWQIANGTFDLTHRRF